MSSIRVRLCIERGGCSVKAEQYWMLVDTSSCKFVHDLEYLIRKKFFKGGHTTVLNLFLDDFLLPPHEKIAVIRDNDLIRVSEDKALPTFNKEKLSNDKNENPKKRKLEDSNCCKKKSKKRKYSSTKSKKEQDMVPSKIPTESQSSLHMTTRQEVKEFYKKLLNDKPQKISWPENFAGSSTQTKKHQTKSLKKKSSALSCFLEKFNPSSDKRSKKGLHSGPSLPLSFKSKYYVEDVQNRNGIPKPKDVSASNKKDGVTVHKKKSSSQNSSSSTSSSSCSSQSSSDQKSDTDKKNICNGYSASERNEPQEVLKPQTADPGVKNRNQGVCLSKQGTRNHIRFDYDCEPANGTAEKASLPSRDISPACPATSNNNGISRTPILSPIQKNTAHVPVTDSTQKKLATENNAPKGRCSINNFRKDVYTYKSSVLESTRIENEPEDALSSAVPASVPANVPANVPEFKDFSKYQPLVGPPRVGETVAYKILELSQSYTPELSQYKVGKVISFDPGLKSMKLKLTKNSLSRVTGDGNVSSKFELFDDNEEEEPTMPVEIPDKVEVYWTSMIDPRLVVEPAIIS